MNESIIITIPKHASSNPIVVEVNGVKGGKCAELTAKLVAAAGTVEVSDNTCEMYETQNDNENNQTQGLGL